jgi:hypothetical protein
MFHEIRIQVRYDSQTYTFMILYIFDWAGKCVRMLRGRVLLEALQVFNFYGSRRKFILFSGTY